MAEVALLGLDSGPPADSTANTLVDLVERAPAAEFTSREFFTPPTFVPASSNPSDNDLIYFVTASVDSRTIEVALSRASDGAPVEPQLDLVLGALAPAGVVGLTARFITPTGGTPLTPARTPLVGATATIESNTANRLVFVNALPATPTLTDRLVIVGIDRALRRTPLLEVVLD